MEQLGPACGHELIWFGVAFVVVSGCFISYSTSDHHSLSPAGYLGGGHKEGCQQCLSLCCVTRERFVGFQQPGGCMGSCKSPLMRTYVWFLFDNQTVLVECSGYHSCILGEPRGILNLFHFISSSDNELPSEGLTLHLHEVVQAH